MNTTLIYTDGNFLPMSLRLARLMIGVMLVAAITLELSLSDFWILMLSTVAIYSFVTALFGRDPVFA